MPDECGLERMQPAVGRQALDRRDLATVALRGQCQAGQDRLAVEEDCAGPAGSLVAALLGAGQAEVVAQRVEQRDAAVEPDPPPAPVDAKRDLELRAVPPASPDGRDDVSHGPIVRAPRPRSQGPGLP